MTDRQADRGSVVLQVVYDQLRQHGVWPTFAQVDRVLDRVHGISDAQAALAALPAKLMPRSWSRSYFSDTDEVRLTLRGVSVCAGAGAQDDLTLLVAFLRWAAEREHVEDADPVEVTSLARVFQ
ncbi:hypothetical protein [Dactylosporangium sp. NPDC050588]|uniref:hypothetical protein n=1 Tax=Dactylosporangium sp. NPDC050588 TaxID=3157211 RepID=UPI0033DE88F7